MKYTYVIKSIRPSVHYIFSTFATANSFFINISADAFVSNISYMVNQLLLLLKLHLWVQTSYSLACIQVKPLAKYLTVRLYICDNSQIFTVTVVKYSVALTIYAEPGQMSSCMCKVTYTHRYDTVTTEGDKEWENGYSSCSHLAIIYWLKPAHEVTNQGQLLA